MTEINADISAVGPSAPWLVWFDAEFTSLEFEAAQLLQVATLVTTYDLRRVLPEGGDLCSVVRLPPAVSPSPWVCEQLPLLVKACRAPDAPILQAVENALLALLDRCEAEARRAHGGTVPPLVLAGNSVHNDWWLVRRDFPRFLKRLHYRHLDVTSFKLEWKARGGVDFDKTSPALIRAWFPAARLPAGDGRHDAAYDVQASIAELAFYRASMMPGGSVTGVRAPN